MFEGPVAQDATQIFIKNWELAKYLQVESNPFPFGKRTISKILQDYYYNDKTEFTFRDGLNKVTSRIPLENSMHEWLFPEIPESEELSVPVRLIFDSPIVDRDSKVANTLAFLLDKAEFKVRIFSPYLTITKDFHNLLVRTAKRGVKVEIMTNSLESHDLGDFAYLGAVSHYKSLLEAGIEIHEWNGHTPLTALETASDCTIGEGQWPGKTLHTKAVVIDDRVSMVGSHNLNVRSEDYNSEVMALVMDREFASQLDQIFEEDLDQATPRTVLCGESILERPARTQKVTLEMVEKFIKSERLRVLVFKHFQHLM
jgi:phosphatidylserine/phosphatidylglycerophosphate/cardiolipin synthase-like enzyme